MVPDERARRCESDRIALRLWLTRTSTRPPPLACVISSAQRESECQSVLATPTSRPPRRVSDAHSRGQTLEHAGGQAHRRAHGRHTAGTRQGWVGGGGSRADRHRQGTAGRGRHSHGRAQIGTGGGSTAGGNAPILKMCTSCASLSHSQRSSFPHKVAFVSPTCTLCAPAVC